MADASGSRARVRATDHHLRHVGVEVLASLRQRAVQGPDRRVGKQNEDGRPLAPRRIGQRSQQALDRREDIFHLKTAKITTAPVKGLCHVWREQVHWGEFHGLPRLWTCRCLWHSLGALRPSRCKGIGEPMRGVFSAGVAVALLASAGSSAQAQSTFGMAGVLCSQYNKAARSSDMLYHQASQWLLGYISGMNAAMTVTKGTTPVASLTNDQVLKVGGRLLRRQSRQQSRQRGERMVRGAAQADRSAGGRQKDPKRQRPALSISIARRAASRCWTGARFARSARSVRKCCGARR